MSRKILGLEIRTESIAAVLLDSGFKASLLEKQGYFPISPAKDDDDGLTAGLKTVVETLKPTGATCVLGIPARLFSFRNLSLPFHDTKKIKQILPFELEPTLPFPVDELIFDFEAVRRDGQQDLLAFTIQKSHIQQYRELLKAVDLRPVVIMPGGYAAARFIAAMATGEEDLVVIDTGEGNHTIYVVCAGHVRMVRSLPVAGGGPPDLRNLEAAMRQTLTAMRENLGITANPSAVFSIGPGADWLRSGRRSPELMGLPVKSIDSIRTFPKLKGSLDTPEWASGRLDGALALALMETEAVDGVNFSTERSTLQHYWSEYRSHILLSGCLIALTLAIALGGQWLAIKSKSSRLADLDRQIEQVFRQTFPDVDRVQAPLQQMEIKLREIREGDMGVDFAGDRVRVIDILNALSRQIPSSADVKVNRMVVGTDNVVLSGTTDTFNTVDDIKIGLEAAEIFRSVTISSADLEKSGNRVRFKLKLDF